MSSTYTPNLNIELIGTGDQAGSWGDTTNYNWREIEEAVSGYQTVAVTTGTTTTLTIPNGVSTLPHAIARNMYIEVTGTGGVNTYLEVPTGVEKLYFIYNNTNSFIQVRTPSTAAVFIPQGVRTVLVCNGTVVTSAINGLVDNTGNSNMLLGFSNTELTTGVGNTAVGRLALGYNQTGNYNVAVGSESGYTYAGTGTVSIGGYAQYGNMNASGDYNIAIGYSAGYDCSTGTNNIAIGRAAYQGDGTNSQTGSNNVLIGYAAGQSFTTQSNCVVLGGYTGTVANNSTIIADGAGNIRMFYDGSGNTLDLRTLGAVRLYIDSLGNVGIGTGSTSSLYARLKLLGTGSSFALDTPNIVEKAVNLNNAATGVINYYLTDQSVLNYYATATSNWTINFRASSGTTLGSVLQQNQSITAVFMATQGAIAYYNNVVQIDGTPVTPKWQGGSAPTSGNPSSIDVYTYTIIKTGTSTYTVLASQTQFK